MVFANHNRIRIDNIDGILDNKDNIRLDKLIKQSSKDSLMPRGNGIHAQIIYQQFATSLKLSGVVL